LCRRLGGIDRATLLRWVRRLDPEVLRLGKARRSAYALRRPLRGRQTPIPLYRIDEAGNGHLLGRLSLIEPEGSALEWVEPCPWPLDDQMADGWFEGLPYPLYDMAPQGFLGRHFAHRHAQSLGVSERLADWSAADIAHVLATLGQDQPGDLILGEASFEAELQARAQRQPQAREDYPALAERALAFGDAGSSAGGEFPKFATLIAPQGEALSVIVKFSGDDETPAVQRWSDLLVAEHLALETLRSELAIPTAQSHIEHQAGRRFLEVERFDRVGRQGRAAVCSLASLNPALVGLAGEPWPEKAQRLHQQGWLSLDTCERIRRLWWFGRLIANNDMHDGNLAFRPGLILAPVSDMLPMQYAPTRSGKLPPINFQPALPLPGDQSAWLQAHEAAIGFWNRCAAEPSISSAFRKIAADNCAALMRLEPAAQVSQLDEENRSSHNRAQQQ
ncbi:MAG: type II toxin-antitoxin system HipA family toxin YjjJ, partial [Lamprobacter sp.]|uniref:type II toxin-antitoxin system HipA family toxin YjjJ n=1 Tax=Lamprobacter sp. TaxID=3100796 RepID=UPI002B25C36B